MRARLGLLATALACVAAAPAMLAAAQDPPAGTGTLVDRVVAIVGDSAILQSQVIQQENQARAQGIPVPAPGTRESEDFRAAIVENLVNTLVLLQAAARDTLMVVDPERVESVLQAQLDSIESSFVDRAAMERALREEGMTLQTFREMLQTQIRQQLLVELYMGGRASEGAVEVSDEEVRAAFDAGRESLAPRPADVTFRQIAFRVTASDSAQNEARERLQELLDRARAGEDFAELAAAHSQDPGTAAGGGDLGWFRRDQFVEEFADAAFGLPEGGISDIVQTTFGFHVIMVERVRFAERKARHILIRPEAVAADRLRARNLAQEIADRVRTEDLRDLIDEYHEADFIPDSVTIEERRIASALPAAYLSPLRRLQPGETGGPIQFRSELDEDAFAVVLIVRRRPAGEYTFEDFEEQLRNSLAEQKRIEAHIESLKAHTYIEIK